MFIDFHTHSLRNKSESDVLEILSIHAGEEKEKTYYTIGHHPWMTNAKLSDEELTVLKNRFLNDKFCLAIGEFGLDKLRGPSLEVQEDIVRQQLELAQNIQAPVIIHCVRQYDVLLKLKQEYEIPAWIIHGYYRNKVLAQQLIRQDFYLSFCCHQNAPQNFITACVEMPLDKMFLETDSYADVDIKKVYEYTASLKKIEIEELQDQILNNIKKVFYKWDIG